jgi:hypothetical protein
MALSVKASFTAISIPLSTSPMGFKPPEGKTPLSLKNRLRIILYEQGRTGSIQHFFLVFLICAAKPQAVVSYRERTDKLAYAVLD